MADIVHTTDFSPASAIAFRHALRLSVGSPGRLDILHVHALGTSEDWTSFPHVRQVLSEWGLLPAHAMPADIAPRLGIHVSKVEVRNTDPLDGIEAFFRRHRPDLVVVATHGRQGINRWLSGSVSESMVIRTLVPTLMIGPESRGFVASRTGELVLGRVLVPVSAKPSPIVGLAQLTALLARLGLPDAGLELVSIGADLPELPDDRGRLWPVERLDGPIEESILSEARRRGVSLIAMPTAGRHGFVDAIRGSTTSRVLAEAPCPVLALPAMEV